MPLMHRYAFPILALMLLTACTAPSATIEEGIRNAIEEANYCVTADDCSIIGNKCPFGCEIVVNRNQATRIANLAMNFPSDCTYSCIATNTVGCINGKCTASAVMTKSTNDIIKGNTGASCDTHDDCNTPMDYLTRSSCPFVSMCVDGACAITCPDTNATGSTVSCAADINCTCDTNAAGEGAECRCIDGKCAGVVKEG